MEMSIHPEQNITQLIVHNYYYVHRDIFRAEISGKCDNLSVTHSAINCLTK